MKPKKPVLVRLPSLVYEELLNWSAEATLERRRVISVPALVTEIVEEKIEGRNAKANQVKNS